MLKFAIVLAAVTTVAATSAPVIAQETTAPAATVAAPAAMPAPTATKISASAMATDPRMVAAIRHANATADLKCGAGVGTTVDLATKATAQRCRRRMVDAAKLDAEGEIEGR